MKTVLHCDVQKMSGLRNSRKLEPGISPGDRQHPPASPLRALARPKGGGVATRVRSGSPRANEMVRWTISSDERRELERAAGPLGKPELRRMGVYLSTQSAMPMPPPM